MIKYAVFSLTNTPGKMFKSLKLYASILFFVVGFSKLEAVKEKVPSKSVEKVWVCVLPKSDQENPAVVFKRVLVTDPLLEGAIDFDAKGSATKLKEIFQKGYSATLKFKQPKGFGLIIPEIFKETKGIPLKQYLVKLNHSQESFEVSQSKAVGPETIDWNSETNKAFINDSKIEFYRNGLIFSSVILQRKYAPKFDKWLHEKFRDYILPDGLYGIAYPYILHPIMKKFVLAFVIVASFVGQLKFTEKQIIEFLSRKSQRSILIKALNEISNKPLIYFSCTGASSVLSFSEALFKVINIDSDGFFSKLIELSSLFLNKFAYHFCITTSSIVLPIFIASILALPKYRTPSEDRPYDRAERLAQGVTNEMNEDQAFAYLKNLCEYHGLSTSLSPSIIKRQLSLKWHPDTVSRLEVGHPDRLLLEKVRQEIYDNAFSKALADNKPEAEAKEIAEQARNEIFVNIGKALRALERARVDICLPLDGSSGGQSFNVLPSTLAGPAPVPVVAVAFSQVDRGLTVVAAKRMLKDKIKPKLTDLVIQKYSGKYCDTRPRKTFDALTVEDMNLLLEKEPDLFDDKEKKEFNNALCFLRDMQANKITFANLE